MIKPRDFVWYNDEGYAVLEVTDGMLHIEPLSQGVIIEGFDDIWIEQDEVIPFDEGDYEEWQ